MSINKVLLLGNVGKDPVVKYFDKGVAKATFPLATSETFTNQQGETITSTEWHNIVLWRALAEVAEKTVKKGNQVYIVGKIKTRSYVDKDGNNKYITEILADTMMVMEKKQVPGEKTGPSHEVNEPVTPYQVPGENPNKNMTGKAGINGDEPGPFNTGPGTGHNPDEDDLPF